MIHKHLTRLSRILFLIWFADEVFASYHRNDSGAIQTTENTFSAVFLFVPLVWATRLPRSLRYCGFALQALSLIVMIGARHQLIKAGGFGWGTHADTQPQRHGWYAELEHPIYLSMLVYLLGWATTNPIAILAMPLACRFLSSQVVNERAHLARLGVRHRGLDSGLWDRLAKLRTASTNSIGPGSDQAG